MNARLLCIATIGQVHAIGLVLASLGAPVHAETYKNEIGIKGAWGVRKGDPGLFSSVLYKRELESGLTLGAGLGKGEMTPKDQDLGLTLHLGYKLPTLAAINSIRPHAGIEYTFTPYLGAGASRSTMLLAGFEFKLAPRFSLGADALVGRAHYTGNAVTGKPAVSVNPVSIRFSMASKF